MKKSKSLISRTREMYKANPNVTSKQIVAKLNCTIKQAYATLYFVRKEAKNSSPPSSGKLISDRKTDLVKLVESWNKPEDVDLVNEPPHYKDGGIETIDYIEAKGLNYHLGNVVKYVSRAGKKGQLMRPKDRVASAIVDLEKAKWYLERELVVAKSFRDSLGG
jgi:hypothetical protein